MHDKVDTLTKVTEVIQAGREEVATRNVIGCL